MGYEKCREKKSQCSWDKVFEKYGRSETNFIELGTKWFVEELE